MKLREAQENMEKKYNMSLDEIAHKIKVGDLENDELFVLHHAALIHHALILKAMLEKITELEKIIEEQGEKLQTLESALDEALYYDDVDDDAYNMYG